MLNDFNLAWRDLFFSGWHFAVFHALENKAGVVITFQQGGAALAAFLHQTNLAKVEGALEFLFGAVAVEAVDPQDGPDMSFELRLTDGGRGRNRLLLAISHACDNEPSQCGTISHVASTSERGEGGVIPTRRNNLKIEATRSLSQQAGIILRLFNYARNRSFPQP